MELLAKTLECLRALYKKEVLEPGKLTRVGLMPKWNAVIASEQQCGVTLNFTENQDIYGKAFVDVEMLRSFIGADLFKVAEHYLNTKSLQERSIGASAVCALSQPLLTPESLMRRGYRAVKSEITFPDLLTPNDIVVMVGYGGRGLDLIPGKCREFHVTEFRPRKDFHTLLVDTEAHFVPTNIIIHGHEENNSVLENATAVFITGSSLVNGTLEGMLKHTKKARIVDVWGPSASIIPDVLFTKGVNYLEAWHYSDPQAFEQDVLNNQWDLKNGLLKKQTPYTITKAVKR